MATTGDPPKPDRRLNLAWLARAVRVRLRFLAALVVASAIVGGWDVLRTYWDRWTAPMARDPAMGAVSADTEYFCPMDPGVLSGWPGQCPVCRMATVRRPKGDMGPLPSGVVARVQLSPDRVQLGGVRSEAVGYRPLAREFRSVGPVTVEGALASIRLEFGAEGRGWLEPGQSAEVVPDPPDGTPPSPGRVRSVEGATLVVEVDGPPASLRLARLASVVVGVPMAGREPFRSMPRGEPPLRPGDPRAVFTCEDHPEILRVEAGRCPLDGRPLDRSPLSKSQGVGWWCPMHPKVVADRLGQVCEACGGMPMVPRVVAYSPRGEVLALPESAVIDTGSRRVAYVERMPGVFDGVEVRLGPRCGTFYPVVEGLEAGQVVASAGAFLVDAETRLNPSLAAGYFGSRRQVEGPPALPSKPDDLSGLSPSDRALAESQATCPVTGKRLGSMGTPPKVDLGGRSVFLCCDGCAGAIREAPDKFLAKGKLKGAGSPVHHP